MIALSHGFRGAYEGPYCQGTAEGDEWFFSNSAGEFLTSVFFIKVAEMKSQYCGILVSGDFNASLPVPIER